MSDDGSAGRGSSGVLVRDLAPDDASALASVHVESFPSFFLTSLGERFLRRFYRALLAHPLGFGIGVVNHGRCDAFAVGAYRAKGVYRDLARADFVGLLSAGFPVFLRHPGRLVHILRAIRAGPVPEVVDGALLCSICVSPTMQGIGLGAATLRQFERRAHEHGCRSVVLTTDAVSNERANGFYRARGYELVSIATGIGGRRMNCYRKMFVHEPTTYGDDNESRGGAEVAPVELRPDDKPGFRGTS